MKLIIAGSRELNDYSFVEAAVKKYFPEVTEIVSGGAKGIDKVGEDYAKMNNLKLTIFPAGWDTYGKAAGYRRNIDMSKYGDACLVIWNGISRGSKHMIDIASKCEMKTVYYNLEQNKIYKNY